MHFNAICYRGWLGGAHDCHANLKLLASGLGAVACLTGAGYSVAQSGTADSRIKQAPGRKAKEAIK